jgi:hypothetical protein
LNAAQLVAVVADVDAETELDELLAIFGEAVNATIGH